MLKRSVKTNRLRRFFPCFLFIVTVIALSSLIVGEVIFPYKDKGTAIPFELEGSGELTYSGITPYSRNQENGPDYFAIRVKGPTILNFSFELSLHPERDSCKGIEIEYYEKTKNDTFKKVYLYDSLGRSSIDYFDCKEEKKEYKNEEITFKEGEYLLRLDEAAYSASKYKLKINYGCIEGFFSKNKDYQCVEGKWVKYYRVNVSDSKKPKEIPKGNSDAVYVCDSGCVLEDKCYPFGYTIQEKYCSESTNFKEQRSNDESCKNAFECKSGVCADGKCVSVGFIRKILNWFKRIFRRF